MYITSENFFALFFGIRTILIFRNFFFFFIFSISAANYDVFVERFKT